MTINEKYIGNNLEDMLNQSLKECPVVYVIIQKRDSRHKILRDCPGRNYVTLTDPKERMIAKTNPELFLQLHKPPVLIENIQLAPELYPQIKMYVDQSNECGLFLLSSPSLFAAKKTKILQKGLEERVAVLNVISGRYSSFFPKVIRLK